MKKKTKLYSQRTARIATQRGGRDGEGGREKYERRVRKQRAKNEQERCGGREGKEKRGRGWKRGGEEDRQSR